MVVWFSDVNADNVSVLLDRLARAHRLDPSVILSLAREAVLAVFDPLYDQTQEKFVLRKRYGESDNATKLGFGRHYINFAEDVPGPDDNVDLKATLEEWEADVKRSDYLITRPWPSGKPECGCCMGKTELMLEVSDNQHAWFRFLAARHPLPEARAKFGAALRSIEKVRAANLTRARAVLMRKRAVS